MEEYIKFDKATLVKVQAVSPTTSEEDDCKGSGSYFPLLWALGGVNAIQLVFIFIIVCRFACRGTNNTGKKSQQSSEDKRDQDPDTLNYAALNFTEKKRKPRRREERDPHVIYAATR
ncbi:hypothetical protein SKAU_G00430520 [Synaphobranchus kaupii]|uniref:Uncharacterized protein n=1 Tax=Synaphobranchus kaupii TaxID=118154 RepID=A0A9Q1IA01_SYNKA|nr:hypothetical protein SKAU_G00430520 [Synaphobranchus kaupii]